MCNAYEKNWEWNIPAWVLFSSGIYCPPSKWSWGRGILDYRASVRDVMFWVFDSVLNHLKITENHELGFSSFSWIWPKNWTRDSYAPGSLSNMLAPGSVNHILSSPKLNMTKLHGQKQSSQLYSTSFTISVNRVQKLTLPCQLIL